MPRKETRNVYSDLFELKFIEEQIARGLEPIPYIREKHDFVQLVALCERAKQAGWPLTTDRWLVAVENYFRSEVGIRTIAHLSVKFSAYYRHPLDRFGQPLRKPGGHVKAMQQNGNWETQFLRRFNKVWAAHPDKHKELATLLDQSADEHLDEVEADKRLGEIENAV